MDFTETDYHDIERAQNALLEGREKATQTIVELSNLIKRVDSKLVELMQIRGHPHAMCDVVAQLSKNKKLDRLPSSYTEAAVPAVVLVKKR